jgi:group II intron reverse transcriptase/maturase
MNPEGDIQNSNLLFKEEIPVWYQDNGKVSPKWLSACQKERNQTQELMERISCPLNLKEALRRVVINGGSGGIDKMQVKELKEWFVKNLSLLQRELLEDEYKPQPVKGVRIPKPKGGYRLLGIPTVKDRLVQQAIFQVLNSIYDPTFSPQSFGFRPKRSARQALAHACKQVQEGKRIIVDIDLEKFFDQVHHHRLLWLLGTRIGDRRVITLIHRFLKSGIMEGGLIHQRVKGTPQGSPLSPLLSNIVLDELDQELSRRGIKFARYADDLQMFVSSRESAERIMASVTRFIEERMRLKVNKDKSAIRKYYESNFLGHSILCGKVGLSKSSEERFKNKLRAKTKRNRGVSLATMIHELTPVLVGWLQYFKYAQMKEKMKRLESWLRRRLKCFRLKQCKRVIGMVRFLRKLGVEEKMSWKTALSGKRWWRLSNSPAIAIGMNNKWFEDLGFYSLTENYKKLHCNIL